MRVITTAWQEGKLQRQEETTAMDCRDYIENNLVNLYPEMRYQTLFGIGGAITESAGYVFSQLKPGEQEELVNACFGPDGLGYTIGRAPVDSCDFALGNYSAVTDDTDKSLSTFSLERDERYILPLIKAAQNKQPSLQMLLSPWSPPAFMKTNGKKNDGGSLRPEYREMWARYLCRYVQEYLKRDIPVFALSVQNEPNACQRWDSCLYTASEEQLFLRDFLYPAMVSNGLEAVRRIIWDHNKERIYERVRDICADPEANTAVDGAGYHWYSGDHFESLHLVKEKYPDKMLIFTEGCIEYSLKEDSRNKLRNAQRYAHEMIGSFNAGCEAFLDWNILLDIHGGPNHVGNFCEAPIMYAPESGLHYNPSYYYIRHFSRYIRPGASRIAWSSYDSHIEMTAFCNPDDSLAAVFFNPLEHARTINLRIGDVWGRFVIPDKCIATVTLEPHEWKSTLSQ